MHVQCLGGDGDSQGCCQSVVRSVKERQVLISSPAYMYGINYIPLKLKIFQEGETTAIGVRLGTMGVTCAGVSEYTYANC